MNRMFPRPEHVADPEGFGAYNNQSEEVGYDPERHRRRLQEAQDYTPVYYDSGSEFSMQQPRDRSRHISHMPWPGTSEDTATHLREHHGLYNHETADRSGTELVDMHYERHARPHPTHSHDVVPVPTGAPNSAADAMDFGRTREEVQNHLWTEHGVHHRDTENWNLEGMQRFHGDQHHYEYFRNQRTRHGHGSESASPEEFDPTNIEHVQRRIHELSDETPRAGEHFDDYLRRMNDQDSERRRLKEQHGLMPSVGSRWVIEEQGFTACPPNAPIDQKVLAMVRSENPHLPLADARKLAAKVLERYPALRG